MPALVPATPSGSLVAPRRYPPGAAAGRPRGERQSGAGRVGNVDLEDLYALPPEDFTAARTASVKAAKAAGDAALAKQIAAQRRPTTSAWLVNRLTREAPELLDELLALGPALGAAQAAGRADELRKLGRQRRELVAALAARAGADVGRAVPASTRAEVEQTLEAALADPASAAAVRSGRLVRALSFAGFGGVELSGAVAVPVASGKRDAAGEAGKPADRARGGELAAAEEAALAAAGALDDAVRRYEQAEQDRGAARDAAVAARAGVERLRAALDEAVAQQQTGDERAREADETAASAAEQVRRAQADAERARTALDRLRRGSAR
jgi:hypothetical protein